MIILALGWGSSADSRATATTTSTIALEWFDELEHNYASTDKVQCTWVVSLCEDVVVWKVDAVVNLVDEEVHDFL
jgi:hypothetical protein